MKIAHRRKMLHNKRKIGTSSKGETTKDLHKDVMILAKKVNKLTKKTKLPIHRWVTNVNFAIPTVYSSLPVVCSLYNNATGTTSLTGVLSQQIKELYVHIKGEIYNTGDDNSFLVRMLVVRDHQPLEGVLYLSNGISSTYGDSILENANVVSSGANVLQVTNDYVYNEPRRFTVLHDSMHNIYPTSTALALTNKIIDVKIPLHYYKVSFDTNPTTGYYEQNSQINLYFVSTPEASTKCSFYGSVRYAYVTL